jgi:hypothetical protein
VERLGRLSPPPEERVELHLERERDEAIDYVHKSRRGVIAGGEMLGNSG